MNSSLSPLFQLNSSLLDAENDAAEFTLDDHAGFKPAGYWVDRNVPKDEKIKRQNRERSRRHRIRVKEAKQLSKKLEQSKDEEIFQLVNHKEARDAELSELQNQIAASYFRSLRNPNCRIILGYMWRTHGEVWKIVSITGDGHCFARALAYYLFGNQHEYPRVKNDFLLWFQHARVEMPFIHLDLVENGFWTDDKRLDGILAWLESDGKKKKIIWPDNVEELILLFEVHLQKRIRLWTCFNGEFSGSCVDDGDVFTLVNSNTKVGEIDCSHFSAVVHKANWVV